MKHLRSSWCRVLVCLGFFVLVCEMTAIAANQTVALVPIGSGSQSGEVVITTTSGGATLQLTVSGLTPNTVHSFWQVFDTTKAPFITDPVLGLSVVTDTNLGTLAPVRPGESIRPIRFQKRLLSTN